jgi:predicted permease
MRASLRRCPPSRLQRATFAVALLFGLLSVIAGGRVLLGADPGYVAYTPLVIFNTLMGFAYIAAAVVIRGSAERGRRTARAIVLLNLVVLVFVVVSWAASGPIAVDSVRAMAFRAAVWIGIFAALGSVVRPSTTHEVPVIG